MVAFSQPKALFKKYDSTFIAANENYRSFKRIKDSGYLPNKLKFIKTFYYDNSGNLVMVDYLKGDIKKSIGTYEIYYYYNNTPATASRMQLSTFKENRYFFYGNDVYEGIRIKSKEDDKAIPYDPNYIPPPPRYQYVRVHDPILVTSNKLLQEFLALKTN